MFIESVWQGSPSAKLSITQELLQGLVQLECSDPIPEIKTVRMKGKELVHIFPKVGKKGLTGSV